MKVIEQIDGKVILRFGKGRLLIAPCEHNGHRFIGVGTFRDKQFPVDVVINEVKGEAWDEHVVAMYFDTPESLDSMIHVLQDFKKSEFGEPTP